MQTLRTSKLIAHLVLVWFVLFNGIAIASSIANPSDMQLVCSVGGKLQIKSTNGDEAPELTAGMECPLCAAAYALPSSSNNAKIPNPQIILTSLVSKSNNFNSTVSPSPPSRGPPFRPL